VKRLFMVGFVLAALVLVFWVTDSNRATALDSTQPTSENPPAEAAQTSKAAIGESAADHEPASGYPVFSVEQFEVKPSVSRSWTQRDHTFTFTATVTNQNTISGTYSAVFQIDGTKASVKNLLVDSGSSEVVESSIARRIPGTYHVAFSPFVVSTVRLDPSYARLGQEVTISADVTNVGTNHWQETLALKLDGLEIATQEVTLSGGESTKVEFTGLIKQPGVYTIKGDSVSGKFTIGTNGYILDRILGSIYAAALVTGVVLSARSTRRTHCTTSRFGQR